MVLNLLVGEMKTVDSRPSDAANNKPAFVKPGTLGNTGTQWFPQTPGICSVAPTGPEGVFGEVTGTGVGTSVVNIRGLAVDDTEVITPFTVNVAVGKLDHYDPIVLP